MKGANLDNFRAWTPYPPEGCFERAVCSQKYRYCVILMLIYYYLSHVH